MCTDGAAVNLAMYRLVKEEVDEHYMFTICSAHKIELARSDTCKESALNNNCIQNCVIIIIIIINLYFMLSPFFVCFDEQICDGVSQRGRLFLRV